MLVAKIVSVVALAGYLALLLLISRDLRRREVRSFALFLLAMLVWQAGAAGVAFTSDPAVALFFYTAFLGLGSWLGLFHAQFSRDFLGVRAHSWFLQVGYFVLTMLAIWTLAGGPYVIEGIYQSPDSGLLVPNFGFIFYVLGALTFSYFIYSAFILGRKYRQVTSPLVRTRIKYLLVGLLCVFLGSVANFDSTLKAYPIDMVANAINAFLIAYAILRFQLLDISVVIRKGLLYSVLTVIITSVYFLFVFLALNLFHAVTGYQIFLLSMFLAALTAVAIQPLRDRMQAWLDRQFFREKYDAGLMLQRLSRTAASVLQLDRLTEMILADVTSTMNIGSGAFFIIDEKGAEHRLRTYLAPEPLPVNLSPFRADSPVCVWLAAHQTSMSSQVLDLDPSFIGLWAREREDLKRLKAELFVPLMAAGKLIGILILGPKLSETPFTSGEQLALDTLANQTAVAIENARLFSETLAEKERTATIVEQAFAGIILLDGQLRIVSLNPAAEAIIGRSQAHLIGAPASDVLGRGILGDRGSLRKAMATGERVAPREEILVAGDRQRDVLLGVTPLRDGYLLSLADVTQLKEVDRLKSDIVANVSHEFRTPLAIIKAYSELLMDDALGEVAASRHQYLGIIDAETDRLTGMVSGLLDLARLEAGRGAIVMAPIDLGEVITEVEEFLQPQALARDLTVNVAIACDLPPLKANRELLIAIVSNLVGNAIKFSRAGGRVDVVAGRDREFAVLQVHDQGIGMSDYDLGHLFEKFFRGSVAKEAGVRGTGLGLVLVKEAVEAHGGTIAVTSQLGIGTCFTVSLPVGNSVGPAHYGGVSAGEAWVTDPLMSTAAGSLVGA